MKSTDYWLNKSGCEYAYQQEQRSLRGNTSYRQQEQWLVDHLKRFSEKRHKRLSVLDFGCGFGRIARLLAPLEFVDYFGYDFSASMVEPLFRNPPEGLAGDIGKRIRIAPSVQEAYATDRFDLIVTASVLIHNSESLAKTLVRDMLQFIEPDGEVCLIENKLCALTIKDNDWHDGCWLHNFGSYLPEYSQINVVRNVTGEHDVYLIRHSGAAEPAFFITEESTSPPARLTREEYFFLGMERLAQSIKQKENLADTAVDTQTTGRCHDLEEKLTYLAEELGTEKKRNLVLQNRVELTASIDRWLREIEVEPSLSPATVVGRPVVQPLEGAGQVLWNSDQDCRFANQNYSFDRVCHLFHQEWFGIRAAAGSLPGHKLAISASANWRAGEIKAIANRLTEMGIRAVVVHGMSAAMKQLVEVLRQLGGVDLYLVWHGNTTQWTNRDELELVSMVRDLSRKGTFSAVHALRCGMHELLGDNAFIPQLMNMPPRVSHQAELHRRVKNATVLCPSWNDLRKNLYTNILAGEFCSRVSRILVFATDIALPSPLGAKVSVLPHKTQAATIELMASLDLVSNVTVIDCHPMVNLEALAVGTPTLEGPLFLDALETHPYKSLVRVENALSVSDVQQAMERVLSVPEKELDQMMNDYRTRLVELSQQRYLQFLENSL